MGFQKKSYIHYFEKIYEEFKKTGIIIHNETYGVDELYFGKNSIYIFASGRKLPVCEYKIDMPSNEILRFFRETDVNEHVSKFLGLFDISKHSKEIRMIFCKNVAIITLLGYLCQQEDNKNTKIDEFHNPDFIRNFIDQRAESVYEFFFAKK